MRRILVLRGGALGDFIVTLPALNLLRRGWPTAHIELVGNATAAELAVNRGLLDAAHSQHDARWAALHAPAPLPAELARWLGSFDLVLSYWPDPDGDLGRHFPVHAQQSFVTGAALPAVAPAAAHYCEPLRVLGLVPESHWFRLQPLRSEAGKPSPRSETIAVHPGSGSPRKNWPSERWRSLIATLPPPVLVILGEAEASTWTSLPPGVETLKSAPLEALVGRLAECRLFLGHDSGISHVAAAAGTPSILLFGPTDPVMWAPPAPHVKTLRQGDNLADISVETVAAAIKAEPRQRDVPAPALRGSKGQ